MVEGIERKIPIIKTDEFGLDVQIVKGYIKEAQENLKQTRLSLKADHPKIREWAQNSLSDTERVVEIFTSTTPEDILNKVMRMYDRTQELGLSGIGSDEVARRIEEEFPDFGDYYGLLRKNPWGYRLGQAVFAVRAFGRMDD
jgi:hypothetical protein